MAEGYYGGIPQAPLKWERIWAERVVAALNLLIGKANCTSDLTLEPNQTSTQLNDFRIHPGVVIDFMPLTANAAAAKPSIYVTSIGKGTAIINHASSGDVDQAFRIGFEG